MPDRSVPNAVYFRRDLVPYVAAILPHLDELGPHLPKVFASIGLLRPHWPLIMAELGRLLPFLGDILANIEKLEPFLGRILEQRTVILPVLGVMVPQLPDLLDDAKAGPVLLGGVLDRWPVLGAHFARLAPHFPCIQPFTSLFLACADGVDESGTRVVLALLDGSTSTQDSPDAASAPATPPLASSLLKRSVSARSCQTGGGGGSCSLRVESSRGTCRERVVRQAPSRLAGCLSQLLAA